MTMPCILRPIWPAALGCSLLALSGCWGNDPSVPAPTVAPAPKSYAIGGTVSGLHANGLVLANGAATVAVSSEESTFQFATSVASGTSYSVSVQTQPTGESCSIAGGSGTVTAAVSSIAVTCVAVTHTLGGSISGLTGTGLVLANGSDTLSPAAGATSFVFAQAIAEGAGYDVTISTLPSGENCSVTGGSGTMGSANVTAVQIACSLSAPAHVAAWKATQVAAGQYPLLARDPSASAVFLAWSATDATQPIQASRFTDASGWSSPSKIAPHGVVAGMGFDASGNGFATFPYDPNTVGVTRYTPAAGWTGGGAVIPLPSGPPIVIPPGTSVSTLTKPVGLAVFSDGSADSLAYSQVILSPAAGDPTLEATYLHVTAPPAGNTLAMGATDPVLPAGSSYEAEHIVEGINTVTQYYVPVSVDAFAMVQAPRTKFHAVVFQEIDQALIPVTDYTTNPQFTINNVYGVTLYNDTSSFFHYLVANPSPLIQMTQNGVSLSDNGSALFAWSVVLTDGGAQVFAQRYDGTTFGTAQLLYTAPTTGINTTHASIPVTAIDASGDGIVFFGIVDGTMAVRVDKNGIFGQPVLISKDQSPNAEPVALMALMDHAGNAYFMDDAGALRVRRLAAGSAVWDATELSQGYQGPFAGWYDMVLDRDGFPMAAWQLGYNIYAARYH